MDITHRNTSLNCLITNLELLLASPRKPEDFKESTWQVFPRSSIFFGCVSTRVVPLHGFEEDVCIEVTYA
jgi:hypothetical protein